MRSPTRRAAGRAGRGGCEVMYPASSPCVPAGHHAEHATTGAGRSARRPTAAAAGAGRLVGAGAGPVSWSRPGGAVLRELVEGRVWVAERPFLWNAIDVGGKAGVVRLRDGSLWVHSPVELDADLDEALDELGPVRHVVSPNYEHVKWAGAWKAAKPAAEFWGCPGLSNRVPFELAGEIGAPSYNAPDALAEEFEFLHVDCEINPFGGVFNERKPFFNEVLSFHKPSRTLFVTDLFWNYGTDGLEAGSRCWKFLVGGGDARCRGFATAADRLTATDDMTHAPLGPDGRNLRTVLPDVHGLGRGAAQEVQAAGPDAGDHPDARGLGPAPRRPLPRRGDLEPVRDGGVRQGQGGLPLGRARLRVVDDREPARVLLPQLPVGDEVHHARRDGRSRDYAVAEQSAHRLRVAAERGRVGVRVSASAAATGRV